MTPAIPARYCPPVPNPSVYIETSIVSYLTAWPSKDAVRQGHQEITHRWWNDRRPDFALYTSQFVLDEAADGDPTAGAERLAILRTIQPVAIGPRAVPLAAQFLADGALPAKARLDALHLATATVNGLQYLLTWNCRHLANATMRPMIERTCRSAGFGPPIICTPLELLGSNP